MYTILAASSDGVPCQTAFPGTLAVFCRRKASTETQAHLALHSRRQIGSREHDLAMFNLSTQRTMGRTACGELRSPSSICGPASSAPASSRSATPSLKAPSATSASRSPTP